MMKCPKCGINLLEHIDVCPFCKTAISKGNVAEETPDAKQEVPSKPKTGRYADIDTSKDSYDFDLQYTLTFRDSGEIKKAIADMDAGITREPTPKRSSSLGKSGESRYTYEEMQAAALRAQERRERRKNGGSSNEGGKKRVTRTEKRKSDALRAAKPTKSYSEHKEKRATGKSHRGLLIGGGVLAVVVALIILIVNICSFFANKSPEYPTLYTKGNELYIYFDGDENQISSNFITTAYDPAANKEKSVKNADDDDDDEEMSSVSKKTSLADPKIKEAKVPIEKDLIKISDDGTKIFFLENANMNTKSGNLVYYEPGKKKSRTVLSQNVYYDIAIGKDGKSILYIKNADKDGAHGELCYWTPEANAEISIDKDITTGNFMLSQDCQSLTYIKNFNPTVHTGDLYFTSIINGNIAPKHVDEKVAFVFGTTPKSKIFFYAKNYDLKTGSYDLYIQSDTEGPKSVAEKGFSAPVIMKQTEMAYVYSNYDSKKYQTLNCVDFTTGANTKLTDESTDIVKVRNDEGAVIYSKQYETAKADYYFVSAKSPNPQKVATAINTAAVEKGVVSFDASDDFSKVAYVGGFDMATNKGALYTLAVINDYAGSEMRISDDAYSCDVSADGAVVRFASGYNVENNTVNLVSYANSNTLALSDGVGLGAYTFDKTGEYAIYAKDVDVGKQSGKIESVSKKAKIKLLDEDVSAYGLKKDGTVLLLKKVGEGEGQTTSLYKTKISGGSPKVFTEGVTKVLYY